MTTDPPLIFETMASGSPSCWRQHKTCRYLGITIIPLLRIGDFPGQPTIAEIRARYMAEWTTPTIKRTLSASEFEQEYPLDEDEMTERKENE